MKKMKWLAAFLLTVQMVFSGFTAAAENGLNLPVVENDGMKYYNVTSKADLKTAVLYCSSNFMDQLSICFDEDKRDWDDQYGSNVVNFLDYYTKGFFTYKEYSVNTVVAYGTQQADQQLAFGKIELSYLDTPEELKKADAKIESVLAGISSKSTYDKLLYVAEYVCKQADAGFEQMPDGGYDAINGVCDVLTGVRTNTVCTSFALTFQRFMEKAGINSYIVANGGVHAWNIVELDGKWYGIDCTFGDAGQSFDRSYFLMGKDSMKQYNVQGANVDPIAIFSKNHQVSDKDYGASGNSGAGDVSSSSKPSQTVKPPVSSSVSSDRLPESSSGPVSAESQTDSSNTENFPDASLTVDISKDTAVGRETFQQAIQAGQPLELKGQDYTWIFSEESLADMTELPSSFDAGIQLGEALNEADQKQLASIAGESPYFGFRFAYHGTLPGKAAITLSVGTDLAGKNVTIYSVSDSGEPVAEAEGTVTAGGMLTFETSHCSLWFVSQKGTAAGTDTGASGWLWAVVIAVAVLAAAAGGFCWWYFIWRKKHSRSK